MFNFLKPKKKQQNPELKKKEIESGKCNHLVLLNYLFQKNRNRIIIRFQIGHAFKIKRHGLGISRRYHDRKKHNRNRF